MPSLHAAGQRPTTTEQPAKCVILRYEAGDLCHMAHSSEPDVSCRCACAIAAKRRLAGRAKSGMRPLMSLRRVKTSYASYSQSTRISSIGGSLARPPLVPVQPILEAR